jgi:uncharacterized membrane protein YfcA
MIDAGQFVKAVKQFWLLLLSALPGLLIGIWILSNTQNEPLIILLGLVMVLYGIWGLKNGIGQLSKQRLKQLTIPIGLISGFINGTTGSQIMPIMPFLLSMNMNRELFVQTINCSFTFNTIIMMICFGKIGLLNLPVIYVSVIGIIPVAIGIYLGGTLRKHLSESFYRKVVLILLICLGIRLIVKPLL